MKIPPDVVWILVAGLMRLVSLRTPKLGLPSPIGVGTGVVLTGVYRLSRNPIYLGMLLVVLGVAVALSSPAALALSAVFVVYLDRFQIGPEERALSAVLGQECLDYRARVRRWL